MKLILTFTFALLVGTGFAQVSPPEMSQWISERIVSPSEKSQGLTASDVWDHPWHFAILFNSANAGSNSAYTEAARTSVLRFLNERLKKSSTRYRVSFFPYQLDLYTTPDKSLVDQPLNTDTLQRIERMWPTTAFRVLADGSTTYPGRGGHDNAGARSAAIRLIPTPSAKRPVTVIQVTDTTISEAPGGSSDDLVRDKDGRLSGLDGTSFVAYDVPGIPFLVGPNQHLNIWVYGPAEISGKGSTGPPYVAIVIGVLVVALGTYLFTRIPKLGGSKPLVVQVPGNGPVVLRNGEKLLVVGPGSKETGNVAILQIKELPAATIFEIVNDRGLLKSRSGYFVVEDSSGNMQPQLEVGTQELVIKREGQIRRVRLEISAPV